MGDDVVIEFHGEDEPPLIVERKKRRNAIVRRSVNLSKQSHIVAANLDRAFLIVTIASPETSTGFIDRFLVTAGGLWGTDDLGLQQMRLVRWSTGRDGSP